MLFLHATTPDGLAEAAGEVHDSFFDVDDVSFDAAARVVVVPFRRWEYDERRPAWRATGGRRRLRRLQEWLHRDELEAPWYRWYLRIGQATAFSLRDQAQIGIADFNQLEYDPRRGLLIVECSSPVTITVTVLALDVTVEQTRELLGLARHTRGGDDGEVHPLE
jgi:hypothetical protein